MTISIKQITEDEWQKFAQIRLKALQTDPHVFGSNYARESRFMENDWRERLRVEDSAIFMIFDNENSVGMTGVSVFREDPTGQTAILWGSWLEPNFRGKGLSDLMYKARLGWAKNYPGIKRVIVSHRAANLASKYANQKHGFVFTGKHEKVWADGKVEDEFCYELFIKTE